ncbi:septation protein A [Sphingosinicella rhizophila]|uniref:Inner membrane-spanning protein YciB n=1 Tax=Sphingosinicella rhizophila TaxID=3050082 RepID=A0ABU3Q2L4_9SPHN|nr:septation protein A [Sphingosinicella sp. GR2756]MDT9597567.1 septation protein A [Sphingosinicella sp. GR2756]
MKEEANEPGAGAKLLIDLGPLVVFFAVNAWRGIFSATAAFMIAIIIAMGISRLRYRHISPMLWFSAVMVLVFGSITLYFHNETFIKLKPTIYYAMIAAVLTFGLFTRRNFLKMLLGTTYPGLNEEGWRLLARNWALFFAVMAAVNEAVWRTTSTDFWIGFKLWGFLPATFLFAIANVPMLARHGMQIGESKEEPPIPPSQ